MVAATLYCIADTVQTISDYVTDRFDAYDRDDDDDDGDLQPPLQLLKLPIQR